MYYEEKDAYSVKAALVELDPNAKYVVENNDVNKITWLENYTPIAASVITAKINELKAKYTNEDYKRKRVDAYPDLAEQFDLLYWNQVNGTSKFKEAIAKVKADNPKP